MVSSGNHFDNLVINTDELYRVFPDGSETAGVSEKLHHSLFRKIYGAGLIPLKLRSALWYLLHRVNLDQSWFDEFSDYWRNCLAGATLWSPYDFHFLRNVYRIKLGNISVPRQAKAEKHLDIWQKPAILYQLFDMVMREGLYNQAHTLSLVSKYRDISQGTILEFGCGTAPVTTSYIDFFGSRNARVYIADLKTVFFHYAISKFRRYRNVFPLILSPEKAFLPDLSKPLDVIFCMTVFEHLYSPITVAKWFHRHLTMGGLLVFDFVDTSGGWFRYNYG